MMVTVLVRLVILDDIVKGVSISVCVFTRARVCVYAIENLFALVYV